MCRIKKIDIIRLELPDGKGIFRNDKKSIWEKAVGVIHYDIHVSPEEDISLDYDCIHDFDYIFGFLDKDQYLKWVYQVEWRENLFIEGVSLNTYRLERENCKIGQHQIAFKRNEAILISSESPYI